jgi:hypothetical protein
LGFFKYKLLFIAYLICSIEIWGNFKQF